MFITNSFLTQSHLSFTDIDCLFSIHSRSSRRTLVVLVVRARRPQRRITNYWAAASRDGLCSSQFLFREAEASLAPPSPTKLPGSGGSLSSAPPAKIPGGGGF
ncbi:hypothetical protein Rs2_15097 [Raphanus sativus]|nr:hypothetical protein Rs2_15097 [Raphanus sativus]